MDMKKVLPTGTTIIKIIPSKYATNVTFKLRDRLTNITDTISSVTTLVDENFLRVEFEASAGFLVDGHQYDFWLLDDDNENAVIYRDAILCSNQSIDQDENEVYNINKDVYVTHSTGDNDYIVID